MCLECISLQAPPCLLVTTAIPPNLLIKRTLSLLPQVNDSLVLYDAAISACKACPESVDVQEAMRIYADMQRCLLLHDNDLI